MQLHLALCDDDSELGYYSREGTRTAILECRITRMVVSILDIRGWSQLGARSLQKAGGSYLIGT
eukprot:844488-Pyramimonas_sp.AAC.1